MRVVVSPEVLFDIPLFQGTIDQPGPYPTTYRNSPQAPTAAPTWGPNERHVSRDGGPGAQIWTWNGSSWDLRGDYYRPPGAPPMILDYRQPAPQGVAQVTNAAGPSGYPEPLLWARTDAAAIPNTSPAQWVWIVDEADTDPVLWGPNIALGDPLAAGWHTEPVQADAANAVAALVEGVDNVMMNGATGAECCLVLAAQWGYTATYTVAGQTVTLFTDQTVDRAATVRPGGPRQSKQSRKA